MIWYDVIYTVMVLLGSSN